MKKNRRGIAVVIKDERSRELSVRCEEERVTQRRYALYAGDTCTCVLDFARNCSSVVMKASHNARSGSVG